MTPEEVAVVKAAHRHPHCCIDGTEWAEVDDCLPYRLAEHAEQLAEALAAEQVRAVNAEVRAVALAEALAASEAKVMRTGADHAGHRTVPVETTYLRDCLDCGVTYDATRVFTDQPTSRGVR